MEIGSNLPLSPAAFAGIPGGLSGLAGMVRGSEAATPEQIQAQLQAAIPQNLSTPESFGSTLAGTMTPSLSPAPMSPSSFGRQDLGIRDFIHSVNDVERNAASLRTSFLAGESTNLHQTMIASQEASVAFSLMVELRNKVLEAYQELMRIQI